MILEITRRMPLSVVLRMLIKVKLSNAVEMRAEKERSEEHVQ